MDSNVNVSIDFDSIKRNATKINNEVEVLNNASKRLDAAKEKLQNAWTDTTTQQNAARYLSKVEETQANLNKMVNLIAELPAKLNEFAEKYANMAAEAGGTL